MPALHLVAADAGLLEACLARAAAEDAILLLGLPGSQGQEAIRRAAGLRPLHLLNPLPPAAELPPGIEVIDDDGLVALTLEYQPIVSWF